MNRIDIVFWVLVIGCLYSYAIYPLVLLLLPRFRPSGCAVAETPRISFIITAHNEAKIIRNKIENTLAVQYPEDLLEVIVASDASTDDTDNIVLQYADRGVRLVRAEDHKGKEFAQSLAVSSAQGDLLVFSDAATQVPEDALAKIAEVFSVPEIGAISSEDKFLTDDGEVAGEGLYVRYEMWLRSLESTRAGLVGLSGSFFAARAAICKDWDIVSPSDFNTALNCVRNGFKSISRPDVVGIYRDIKDSSREYQRKVRTVVRGITAISRNPEVLNFTRFGLFSFQVFSHKIMRWLVPWFMLALFIVSWITAGHGILYAAALLAQIVFYTIGLVGWLWPSLRENTLVKVVFFFLQVNVAIAHATLKFLSGQRITTWQPSAR